MNPSDSTGAPVNSSGKGDRLLLLLFLLFLFVIFTAILAGPSAIEQLLLGWLYFPFRVIPRMTADWPSVIVGSVAIVGFVICLHMTLRWLLRHRSPPQDNGRGKAGIRTTLVLAVFVLLMFAAGTAMVGTMHQAVWLVSGRSASFSSRQDEPPVFGALAQAQTAARRTQQRNSMKQIGLAMHNVHDAYSTLPPGGTVDEGGRLLHGWAIYLSGFAGYSSEGIDFSKPWNVPPNDRLFKCALNEYINPIIPDVFDKDGFGLSHVAGNVNVLPILRVSKSDSGAWSPFKAISKTRFRTPDSPQNLPLRLEDIADGTANTLLIGEAAGNYKPWGHPANLRDPALGVGQTPDGFGGPPGQRGAQFVMCDGSVRFISNRVDRRILAALGTPAGGEKTDLNAIDEHSH